MFELLGLSDEIKTYIGDTLYISSPCLVDRIADGTLEVVASNEVRFLLAKMIVSNS